jgi:hypothetical protein
MLQNTGFLSGGIRKLPSGLALRMRGKNSKSPESFQSLSTGEVDASSLWCFRSFLLVQNGDFYRPKSPELMIQIDSIWRFP